MRAIALCMIAAVLAAGASATVCPASNSSNNLYSAASSCLGFTTCGTTFCSCVGSSTTAPATCMANVANTTACSTVARCLLAYNECVEGVPSTSSGCSAYASNVAMARMLAVASGYAGSKLQQSCRKTACTIMNASVVTCTPAANDGDVCMWRAPTTAAPTAAPTNASTNASMTTAAGTTAPGATTLPSDFVSAMTALLVLNGQAWAQIYQNATAWAELRVALGSDIAGILEVLIRDVVITDMTLGSLHVTFAVSAAAGVDPAVLTARVTAAAASTSWLVSTKTAYARVSNETLTIGSFAATATAAPGIVTPVPPTPAPGPGSSIGSASAGVVSAAAAAVAAVVAVFAL